ncbi:MAG: ROK family protein [Planctomycetes bacterium]|nr:ROK family protein [Planctomycetota bacterium]
MSEPAVFAIDFSHTTLSAAVVYPDGREEGTAGFDLADFMVGEVDYIEKLTAMLTAKARLSKADIKLVSVALPCDLSKDRRMVVNFPQALWLNHKPLADILESALGAPVVMERRSVVHLCYDRIMLGLPEDALIAGCYVDEHYENAIWYRGQPLMGKNGAAGNIGHMTIHEREDTCYCGKYGCVDLYGSGVRLRQMHSMIFPDIALEKLFELHGQHPIVVDFLTMMAYPIAIEANILDPDFIIIGGFIPSLPSFPMQTLEDAIRKHCYYPLPSSNLTFLPSSTGGASPVGIAAQYAILQFPDKITV